MNLVDAKAAVAEIARNVEPFTRDSLDMLAHEVWRAGLEEISQRKRRELGISEPSAEAKRA